jgi:8-oxo-dGTP diphosphatase
MNLLLELSEEDIGFKRASRDRKFSLRKAARAVVLNEQQRIALLYVERKSYHKLPGGGLEQGEDVKSALHREVIEEAGVEIRVTRELGAIIEYRVQHELLQLSYGYLALVDKFLSGPTLTEEEKNNGFILKWVPIDEAISLLQNDTPIDYVGRFIRNRDLAYIMEASTIINQMEIV